MKADSGIVNIHGKSYQTVALRVGKFREAHPNYTLSTEILYRDDEMVVMKASILDENSRVIATGHSEERRAASTINKTSALENAETSAIGRALAAFGLGGTEFATADEVANAISQQRNTPVAGSLAALSGIEQELAKGIAAEIVDEWQKGNEVAAYELFYEANHGNELKLGIWEVLQPNSKVRNGIKKISEANKQKAA
jgi:hypothetical protein